jgi:type II secretory pathway pseudopilin PulG
MKRFMKSTAKRRNERGISLLEIMIAGIVLMTGLMLGVMPMISVAVSTMNSSEEETIAKQEARKAMESIFGARDTSQLGWDSVNPEGTCNTNGTVTTCGVFITGAQPMYNPGTDGIVGTDDDAAAGIESATMANGQTRELNEFTRAITIGQYVMPDKSISPSLKTIRVDITYPAGALQRTYTIQGLISQYR